MSPLLTLKLEIDTLYQQKVAEKWFDLVIIQESSYFLDEHAIEERNIWTQFQSNWHFSYPASF